MMGLTFEQQYGHIIKDFQEWFNKQGYSCDCMSQPVMIRDEDVQDYIRIKMERYK